MAELNGPALSVVIPAYNSARTLERCLAAVCSQTEPRDEVIVVDDGSSDEIEGIVRRFPATLLRLEQRSGVAAARNQGADCATRPVLFFVDADVVLHADVVARGRAHFIDSDVDGVIGSYDDEPEVRTLVSQFKNLAHHYFHQRAAGPVGSFWGACGFITRDVFNVAGGFDERRFSRPSIEDVELGWRITDRGGRIVIDPGIQAMHLKRWTLRSLVHTDVFYRAVPWVRWSLERRQFGGELNASPLQQIALALAILLIVSGVASVPFAGARIWLATSAIAAFVVNQPLFKLFWRKGGVPLLMAGFALQQLYYVCALTGLVLGIVRFCWPGRRAVAAPAARAGA